LSSEKVGRRIGLDHVATNLLEASVKELRESKAYIKVNESKLASEIIKLYFAKSYQKDKVSLEKSFFDQKSYLQEIIKKSDNNEELLDSMFSFLSNNKKRSRNKTKQQNQ
jgi:hypothetical protein